MALPCWNCRNPTKEDVLIWVDMCLCFFQLDETTLNATFLWLVLRKSSRSRAYGSAKTATTSRKEWQLPSGKMITVCKSYLLVPFLGILSTTHPWSFVQKPGHLGKKKRCFPKVNYGFRLTHNQLDWYRQRLASWWGGEFVEILQGTRPTKKTSCLLNPVFLEVWTFSFRVPGDFQFDFMMIYLQFTVYVEHMIWTLWSI